MKDYTALMTAGERASLALRALYAAHGFAPFRMSKFEEYDLYARHKDFLVSDQVITFTDTDGKLLALKPDVTLSIVKNYEYTQGGVTKLYYNENVYRPVPSCGFREIMQTGVECLGEVGGAEEREVLALAMQSLATVADSYLLSVSHLQLLEGLFAELSADAPLQQLLCECFSSKNAERLKNVLCDCAAPARVTESALSLLSLFGPLSQVLPALSRACLNETMRAACRELEGLCEAVSDEARLIFDSSVLYNRAYYGGLIFAGYVQGVPESVLSGGNYDKLLSRLARKGRATGFAVYLDRLSTIGGQV